MTKIATVILNYNSAADCQKCVSFLKRQTGVESEIILVDNCSQPEDATLVKQLAEEQGVTFIAANENRGYNAGNNIGLRYAADKGYKYALIANPDMEFPQTDYLKRMIIKMEEDEQIVVCGSNIVTPEGVHQNPRSYKMKQWWHSFDWIRGMLHHGNQENVPDWIADPYISHFCKGVNGCCFLIRMNFVTQIFFFDERIFLYGEESILARQVEVSGKKMYYFAEVTAVHDHKKSREGNVQFRFTHWKHSQLHNIKYYSGFPVYGKWFAILSTQLYFLVLHLHTKMR